MVSISRTLRSSDYTLHLANTEIWTQVEMHYNVVAASIPCFRIFLRAFHTNQLTHLITINEGSEAPEVPSNAATKGQSSAPLSDIIAAALTGNDARSGKDREVSTFEKTIRGYGKTESSAMRNPKEGNRHDGASMGSDWSETAIVVKQTVDVRYGDE